MIKSRILHSHPNSILLLACGEVSELAQGEDVCLCESEFVRHSIEIEHDCNNSLSSLRLDFEGEGVFQSLLNGDHPHTPMLQLSDLLSNLARCGSITSDKILQAYKEEAFSPIPHCYPCDSDFIGIINSKLVSINGTSLLWPVELSIQAGLVAVFQKSGDIGQSSWNSCLNLKSIEIFLQSCNEECEWEGASRLAFNSVTPLRLEGSRISADNIVSSYSQGVSYGYNIENLVLMIADEEKSSEQASFGRLCVDLLAESEEAAVALGAINELVSLAS